LELGASLGVPAVTAHRCLFADGDVAGRTVLVAGGAGAVGHFAIQLARHAGARVVTTVSSAAKAELARAAEPIWWSTTGNRTSWNGSALHERVDRVVEVNLAANLGLDLGLSGPGTVVSVYAADSADPELPIRACMGANVVLRFVLLYGVPIADLLRGVAAVSAASRRGAHRAAGAPLSLEECAAAQEAVQSGAVGKVLLEVG